MANEISDQDKLVCFCHTVPEGDIRQAVREGARTRKEVQDKTLASTGCGGCADEVEKIIEDELRKLGLKS